MAINKIRNIDQKTVECNLTETVRWMNDVVDQLNYLASLYDDLKETVEDHGYRICDLERRMDSVEERVHTLEKCCEEVQKILSELGLDAINQAINMTNNRIDFLYDLLPIPYGLLPGKGWKFAMGNINIMDDNNNTPSTSGPGIFTSDEIEDYDLYFN